MFDDSIVMVAEADERLRGFLAAQLEALEPDELRVLEEAAAILERLLDGAR